ncbi:MAG: hypothetical protein WD928_05075 [Gammaproteobacteria bacterium]
MEEFESELLDLMAKYQSLDRDESIVVLEMRIMALEEEAAGE